ncbi:MAG: HEPN domain-containing protein [Anaerolineae bacterium]
MNTIDEARYRLMLAEGYLDKAEGFFRQDAWHDCVRDAQGSIENAGKSIIACFTPIEKTHDPVKQIEALLKKGGIPSTIRESIEAALPALSALGREDHIRATYGDETTFTPPWDLFDEAKAEAALRAARQATTTARRVFQDLFEGDTAQ